MSATSGSQLTGSFLMPTLDHATVTDAMHPGVLSCDADATATEIARLMAAHHVHCVAVPTMSSDAAAQQPSWGIIADVDLVRAGMRPGEEPTAQRLARQAVSVQPDTPLREAAELILNSGSSHALVVDPRSGRPTGVLSTLDIVGVLAWGES